MKVYYKPGDKVTVKQGLTVTQTGIHLIESYYGKIIILQERWNRDTSYDPGRMWLIEGENYTWSEKWFTLANSLEKALIDIKEEIGL